VITGAVVPLYVHPLVDVDSWHLAERLGAKAACIVVNVADGPGAPGRPDGAYVAWIARLAGRGVTVAGYVDCAYGARSADDVRADVERWRANFAVQSFFLDQFPAVPAPVTAGIVRWLGDTGTRLVAANAGVETHPDSLVGVDVHVAFEGRWPDYRRAVSDGRVARTRANDVTHLVYAVPGQELDHAIGLARSLGAHPYVTSRDGANPWDRLVGSTLETSAAQP
jgi:hypothetical protein